jgi:hypothetical protein
MAREFKLTTRIVPVKSVKDYEEAPDPGEMLIFREKESDDEEIEEVLLADLAALDRILFGSS